MNSKERVRQTIAGKRADRVPLGFYAVDHDIIARVLGRPTLVRNKVEIQLAFWQGRRDEVAESWKKDTVEFYRKIDCADIILPKEAPLLPPRSFVPRMPKEIEPDCWEDNEGRIFRADRHANDITCVYDPNPPREWRREDFENQPLPPPPDPSVFEAIDFVQAELGTERYVAGTTGGITGLVLPDGYEAGLVRYGLDPELVMIMGRAWVAQQNAMDAYCIRGNPPGVLMEQDMAGSNGPLISPSMFAEMAAPFIAERMAHVKAQAPGVQIIFHCCGNTIPIMEHFIAAGVDCYQSLQTTAGMDVGLLKERYGGRLCFWGGVPVETLIAGTPADVRRDVRAAMEKGAVGGGFILGPSHSVAKNTPYENFMAMLDAYVELRDTF